MGEDDLMHFLQDHIHATIMRQKYYEQKALHFTKEKESAEAEIFARYEVFSKQYMDKWLEELMKEGELLESKKNKEFSDAEKALAQAREAARKFRASEATRSQETKAKESKFDSIEAAAIEAIQYHLDMAMPPELKDLYQKAEGVPTSRRPPSPQRRPVLSAERLPPSPR